MSVKITENGFSAVKICIPPNPGEVLRFAAKELASYLYRISKSGTRIWENGETGPGMISISAGKDWEQDSFSVKAENAAVSIHGSNPRGALFGVYELLERIGCVFAGPFDEYVPSILGIELDDFSVTQTASFDRRSVFNTLLIFNRSVHFDGFEPERFLPQIAWLAKRKLNTFVFSVDFNRYDLWDSFRFQAMEELQKRGMKICLVNCSVEYFFPQSEQQDAGNYGTSTYASEHPEYYDAKGFLKINMPEVRRITAERCAAYIASHTELESAALAPSPKLLAHVSPDGTSFMTHYLALFNETARILSVAAPEKKLMVLLHGSLLDLPDGFQFEKNILPVFSSSGVNFHYDRQHSLNSKEYAREKRLAEKIPFVLVDNLGNESSLTPLCADYPQELVRIPCAGSRRCVRARRTLLQFPGKQRSPRNGFLCIFLPALEPFRECR